ncbi:hypothetical protein [Halomicronema hongdechloris]|nr:hypothetical protein [Halomicronema hongdechloris]
MLVVLGVNAFVDPYGIRKAGGRVANDRLVKAIKVSQIKPKVVFLGSSGVARGLNPSHTAFSESRPVYNLSLLGASIYEIKRYFDYAVAHNKLEHAIIGLDFYAFNDSREVRPGFSETRLNSQYISPKDLLGIYLSLDSLNLVMNPDQRGYYFADDGTYEHRIQIGIERQFEIKLIEDFTQSEQMYWNYKFSEATIGHFQSIVESADSEGVRVDIFLPPLHATLFYSAMMSNYWPTYEKWLKRIVNIHPVWDFSGCNTITTEPISGEMNWFEDPSHYTEEVGDLILNKLSEAESGKSLRDFGQYVTSENVNEHLQQVRSQCQKWSNSNPNIMHWLEELNLINRMKISTAE